jgi:predicted AlkP superfamily pyrophosphatase or phosphodiesterase
MLFPRVLNDLPTLFDVLREHNVKFTYLDSTKLGRKLQHTLRMLDSDVQVIIVYLHYLDYAAHRHGLNSPHFWVQVKNMDETVKSIVNSAKQRFGDKLDVIIFSDHGMVETTEFLNFERFMRHKKFGEEFLFFLDSTMVRLWYMNPHVKDEVRRLFNNMEYGTFLSEEEKKKLRINFKHRYYGDDIYLLKPEFSIFPNFISWLKPKAMHAYHPKYDHQLGIAIFSGEALESVNQNVAFIELVDIMPTVLDVLGLEIPTTCVGSSLLRR